MLTYPLEETPTAAHAVTIAPGVQWLRIPLSEPLGFINVWAIADRDSEGEGIALVDTGMGGEETVRAWRQAFAGPLKGKRVTRVFATHMHPDHIGQAGLFTRKHDCRLWITRLEFLTCRNLAADTGREAPEEGVGFYRAAGWEEDMLETYRARFGYFGKLMHPLPDSFMRIRDGQEIAIGDHVWRVVVGAGHSPEHACLYCPDLGLFISGDQVLPRISSNVAVFPTEPEANPLEDWLTSLERIKTLVPDSVLVLPAHNDPFLGLHERIDALIAGHRATLDKIVAHLKTPQRVVDLFPVLFRRPIDDGNRFLATGECLSHLNYLRVAGAVTAETDEQGITWYNAA